MTTTRVSVVQKTRYGVLFIPVVWLLFSIWVVINDTFPRFTFTRVQEVNTPPSAGEIFSVILYGCWTLLVVVKILQALKNHAGVSAELKSVFAFLLGSTMMAARSCFHLSRLFFYCSIVLVDIAAIIMIVTLLQGKPFALLKLYHKDIQIEKASG